MTRQATRPVAASLRSISYAEFLQRYMNGEHVEWVDGKVIEMPAVTNTHCDISLFLTSLLRHALELRQSGVVRAEPYNMKTGPDLPGRSPDILVVTPEHLNRVREDHLEGPADVVFEVISESSRTVDRGDKFREYQTGGVREYWLIDPGRLSLQLYNLGTEGMFHEVAAADGNRYHSTVMPGIWIDPQWLWSKPLPTLAHVWRAWGLM